MNRNSHRNTCNNVIFIFGALETDIADTTNINKIVKINSYIPINDIEDVNLNCPIRYLLDADWNSRCWGCHKLIVEYGYPVVLPILSRGLIVNVLCCSHICQQFIKFYRIINNCRECEINYIPRYGLATQYSNNTNTNTFNTVNQINQGCQSNQICPVCRYLKWSLKLEKKLYLIIGNRLSMLSIGHILRYLELNRAKRTNPNLFSLGQIGDC